MDLQTCALATLFLMVASFLVGRLSAYYALSDAWAELAEQRNRLERCRFWLTVRHIMEDRDGLP